MKAKFFLVVIVLALAASVAPAWSAYYGCRCKGGEIEFYISKSLVSEVLGSGTPIFGAASEGWSNDTPMTASGNEWVARVKAPCSGTETWGFGRKKDGYPWFPSKKMVSSGRVSQADVVDNGFGAYNFSTPCR